MEKTEITCDCCGNILSKESSMPDYYLELRSRARPTGEVVFAIATYPEIRHTMHFCGLKCLLRKLAPE